VAVPIEIPLTMPVVIPTVATGVELLVHIPGVGVLASGELVPMHRLVIPVMGVGLGLTEMTVVAMHVPKP
jgi:hypothetical protein